MMNLHLLERVCSIWDQSFLPEMFIILVKDLNILELGQHQGRLLCMVVLLWAALSKEPEMRLSVAPIQDMPLIGGVYWNRALWERLQQEVPRVQEEGRIFQAPEETRGQVWIRRVKP